MQNYGETKKKNLPKSKETHQKKTPWLEVARQKGPLWMMNDIPLSILQGSWVMPPVLGRIKGVIEIYGDFGGIFWT